MPNVLSPTPLYARKKVVEEFAQRISTNLEFDYSDDLHLFVKKIGGEIFTTYTGKEDIESGSIVIDKNANFKIFISPFTSIERDRFTIAHELGHLFLHYPETRKKMDSESIFRATRYVDPSDEKQQVAEREANWFAASLLMPEVKFKKIYNSQNTRLAELEFKVSSTAVRIRAQSLGL